MKLQKEHITAERLSAAAIVLAHILPGTEPADSVLSRYFRDHRALGNVDRNVIAESVFGVCRKRLALDWRSEGVGQPRQLILAWWRLYAGFGEAVVASLLRDGDAVWLAGLQARKLDEAPLWVRAELPEWVVLELATQMAEADILALGRALAEPAPLDVRVNTLKTTREAVLAHLQKDELAAEATPHSPLGIRLAGRPALQKHPVFVHGEVEVQDEGSQLLGSLLGARRGEMVVDFCAGAGGKTLLLGAAMANTGRLYAFDVSEKRLAKLKPRLARAGLSNIHPQRLEHENDTRVKRLAGKCDRVLVDAPCSGLGTLRRNPDLKWRQTPATLTELVDLQARILSSAARLVKLGGTLVYATCSILPQENSGQIEAFLAENSGWTVETNPVPWVAQSVGGQLWPQQQNTDGFYAAVMTRNG